MKLERIRSKALLGLPLTERERSLFILYGSWSDVQVFLKLEKAA